MNYNRRIRRHGVKAYNIFCDGYIVGSARASTSVSALRAFAEVNSLKTGRVVSIGQCNYAYNMCRKYGRVYPCGRATKCNSVCCMETSSGIIYTSNNER